MFDEGYIKYKIDWLLSLPVSEEIIAELNVWRNRLYDLNLIGFYESLKVGFGNVSQRLSNHEAKFVVSASQTGGIPRLSPIHYSLVLDYNIQANTLKCRGPMKASSESLTHAGVYELNPSYKAVFHAHHLGMWRSLLYRVPTTAGDVPYGTPEMAFEIERLYRETNLAEVKILAMAGHREGIITFGESLEEAGNVLLKWYSNYRNVPI